MIMYHVHNLRYKNDGGNLQIVPKSTSIATNPASSTTQLQDIKDNCIIRCSQNA